MHRLRLGLIRQLTRAERGQYLIQTVILLPMMLLLVGLVIDGGLMYWQYRRAEIAANAAIQVASHTIDVDYFRETNEIRLDEARAWSIAEDFLARNQRGRMYIEVSWVTPEELGMIARARIDTLFLRLAGFNSFTVRVFARAYPAYGINVEGQ